MNASRQKKFPREKYNYYITGSEQSLVNTKVVPKDRNTRSHNSMNYRKRGNHARGVYATQDTLSMRAARVKNSLKDGRKERGHYKGGKSQTRLN